MRLSLNDSAYLLVSHGSRDPRPRIAIEALASLVRDRLAASAAVPIAARPLADASQAPPPIGTGVLELAEQPLRQQIYEFGQRAADRGYRQLQIIPLFLLAGVHVMSDLPTEIAAAQAQLGDRLQIRSRSFLGSHAQIAALLAQPTSGTRILLSHGTRHPQGNQPAEAIAAQIQAEIAYWAIPPSLESKVTALVNQGCQNIEILPYFLFAGGITDAIDQLVASLADQFPHVQFDKRSPIGVSPKLVDMILDLATADPN